MTRDAIPVIVLGGTGYVAGELLRLLVQHPQLDIHGVLSESSAGQSIGATFPQLAAALEDARFQSKDALLENMPAGQRCALFSAAPHGASAAIVDHFLNRADEIATALTVVDVSADFRYATAEAYANVYGQPHGAPQRLAEFASALPEHADLSNAKHIGHPGCFATAMLLGAVPLLDSGICEVDLHATGITGSTGSGRSPTAGTHHPERHSNLFAYKPLAHRHAPEVTAICEQVTGTAPRLHFVPHSGPFARGIHMTLQAKLCQPTTADEVLDVFQRFYADSAFVSVTDTLPRIKNVVGSNRAQISATADDGAVAVMIVIDNLVKGAAGGAVQWMNRKLGFDERTGLDAPAVAWT